ncbi:hypothetical protein I316_04575 [Kwoniella heveanensis BCC8398]|uniref:STB6-like N-terminal domain-containing protein n=1 Tax=Kwoniella heveanensis BCC8398 TaxID=1296120 RepID=A0A1B9GS64_9TREE|nr:hypothetical protein I316_04575 [Kwoniella heveanensis BCC8398]
MSFVLSPVTVSSFSPSSTAAPTPTLSLSPSTSTPNRFMTPAASPIDQHAYPSNGTTPISATGQAQGSPAAPVPRDGYGLLIPTDRPVDDLEERWLPKLGKLRVEREVTLHGYALYSLRSWHLSRTHFSHTIVTQTGKPTEQISAYLLVPQAGLSEHEGAQEIADAVQMLASETQSQPRKTEYGTLLVTTPSAFGQDVNPVPGGDFRVAKPYITVNTGLRRLGCGGRAFIGLEPPIPALRRKFHELYRIPVPSHAAPLSRTTSPTASPTKPLSASTSASPMSDVHSPSHQNQRGHAHAHSHDAITSDPFTYLVIELVKLIQAALALWGLFDSIRDIDGLFCDETKTAIFQWRRLMGMEHEESLKLEKETSGGCIDPKTLAALLSSITSVHYKLDALDVEKASRPLPKDPFKSLLRFLNTWASYQKSIGTPINQTKSVSVSSIRSLHQHYLSERTRHPTDALRVHKLLFSGVAHATSSISANLKGGATEDTPIRKREHHLRYRGDEDDSRDTLSNGYQGESGVDLIVPEGEVGPVAPPDVITTDLEAYIKGILRSREKDWDIMGARRVAELWNGTVAEMAEDNPRGGGKHRKGGRMSSMNSVSGSVTGVGASGSHRHSERGVLRKRTASRDFGNDEGEGDNLKDAIKEISGRAGQALKGGFGLVSRRNTTYETSDSETGGPGPSTLKNTLLRGRRTTVPTVIEPDVEEVDERLDREQSASPSPSTSLRPLDRSFGHSTSSRPSFLTANSHAASKRPSIVTQLSGNESDLWSRASLKGLSPTEERSDLDYPPGHPYGTYPHSLTPSQHLRARTVSGPESRPSMDRSASDRALAWRNRGRNTTMLRTSSDGADVVVEETGMEWEVTNPHGTGKREGEGAIPPREAMHSLESYETYENMRRISHQHLQVDVEMCAVVLELREREKQLIQRVKDVKMLEESIFGAAAQLITAVRERRAQVDHLSTQSAQLCRRIENLDMDIDEDDLLVHGHGHGHGPGGRNPNSSLDPGPTSPEIGVGVGDGGRGRMKDKDRFHYYLSEETHRNELLDDLGKMRDLWVDVRKEAEAKKAGMDSAGEAGRRGWKGWRGWW